MNDWICAGCKRKVFEAKVWHDGIVLCRNCVGIWNLRTIRHEIDTPMRGHDADGECCRRAARGEG